MLLLRISKPQTIGTVKSYQGEESTKFSNFLQSSLLCFSVSHRCEEEGGDATNCKTDESLSPLQRISTGARNRTRLLRRPNLTSLKLTAPLKRLLLFQCHIPESWLSPCQRSWQPGGSSPRLRPTASEAAAR